MGYNSFHNSNEVHPVGGFCFPTKVRVVAEVASDAAPVLREPATDVRGSPGFLPVFWDMKTWIRFNQPGCGRSYRVSFNGIS